MHAALLHGLFSSRAMGSESSKAVAAASSNLLRISYKKKSNIPKPFEVLIKTKIQLKLHFLLHSEF
jgi:hypothetical protein